MTWTNHLVVWLVVIHGCIVVCGAATVEELLQKKEDYRQEVARLFYQYTLGPHEHGGTNTNEGHRSQPLPSPDWSTHHSVTSDDVYYEEELEASQATLIDDENYRPRGEASEGVVPGEGSEDVFSGDSGMFIKVRKLASGGAVLDDDQEDASEDVFSGDSGVFIKEHPIIDDDDDDDDDLNFRIEHPVVVQETTSLAPSVSIVADEHECVENLKMVINSCIEMTLNVVATLREMENFVPESGYYNVSSVSYFTKLFRPCVSNRVAFLQGCGAAREVDVIVEKVKEGIVSFAERDKDRHLDWTTGGHMYFECLHEHLGALEACLRLNMTDERIEGVAALVLGGVHNVATVRQCLDVKVLQRCVVDSMSLACDASPQTNPVDAMFETTLREATTCATTPSGNGADVIVTSRGVTTLVLLSILVLFFHKQTRNHTV